MATIISGNPYFNFYLFSSLGFALVSLFLSFGDSIHDGLLECTSFTPILIFLLCQNLNDAALVGYGFSFFPGYNTTIIVVCTIVNALFCGAAELMLTFSPTAQWNPCHASFISSSDSVIAAAAIYLFYAIATVAIIVVIYIYKPKAEEVVECVNTAKKTVICIMAVSTITLISTVVIAIVEHETMVPLLNYSSLMIIYSVEGCMIFIVAAVTCPITRSQLSTTCTRRKNNAKVNTIPRQQLYCSFALRSHRPHHDHAATTSAEDVIHHQTAESMATPSRLSSRKSGEHSTAVVDQHPEIRTH